MGEITYQPLRSLIYVDCVKEEYRHKLQHWLYYYHAPESIAKFEPRFTMRFQHRPRESVSVLTACNCPSITGW